MASATKRVEKKGEKGAFMRLYFPDDKTVAILSTSDIIYLNILTHRTVYVNTLATGFLLTFFRQERKYVFGSVLCTAETRLFGKRDAKNVPDGKIGNIIPLYVTEKHHKIYHFEFAI